MELPAEEANYYTSLSTQEDDYEWWNRRLRRWWQHGKNRVYAFWFVSLSMSGVVFTTLTTGFLDWDRISEHFIATNELSRAFLASFILVMDLMIVMQDWEFPSFGGGTNIKLPGVNTADAKFNIPGGEVNITGKWFNYGIIFIVMILDLNMWKNQIFYDPFTYGQYTDSENHIYTVCNRTWLKNATQEMLTYEWRWNNTNPWTNITYGLEDQKTNSKYIGYSFSLKGIAFGPSIFAFVLFGFLAKKFSKYEEEEKNRKKTFVVVKEEDEDDWYVEEETADRDMYRRNQRFAEDRRLADQNDPDQMELKSFSREGRGNSVTAEAVSQQKTSADAAQDDDNDDDDDDDNANLSFAQVLRAKKFARMVAQRKAHEPNSVSNSLNSLDDSDNERELPTNYNNKSTLSLESDNQGSKISMSSLDHPLAATNDASSLPSNDSGEESDAPEELSFNTLQVKEDQVVQHLSGRENWNKLNSLSFGDLFRAANVEGSQSSLQSTNEDDARTGGHEISSTNLLKVPDARRKTKR